jgi:hypothetical protein
MKVVMERIRELFMGTPFLLFNKKPISYTDIGRIHPVCAQRLASAVCDP